MAVVLAVVVPAVAACDYSEFGAVVPGSAGCNVKNRNSSSHGSSDGLVLMNRLRGPADPPAENHLQRAAVQACIASLLGPRRAATDATTDQWLTRLAHRKSSGFVLVCGVAGSSGKARTCTLNAEGYPI